MCVGAETELRERGVGVGGVQLKTLSLASHVVSVLSVSVWFSSALLPACSLPLTFFSLLTLFIIHPSVIILHARVVFFFLLLHVISPLLVCSAGGRFCLAGRTLVPNQQRFPADLHPSLVSGDEFRVSLLTGPCTFIADRNPTSRGQFKQYRLVKLSTIPPLFLEVTGFYTFF